MSWDWQTWVAILIVLAAGGVLLQRTWQWARGTGKSGCGSCPNKNSAPLVKTKPLVQIQPRKDDQPSR